MAETGKFRGLNGEERILCPSPKELPTITTKRLSAYEIRDAIIQN